MHDIKSFFKRSGNVGYKLAILLVLYSVSRLLFFFINYHAFGGNSLWELLRIFFFGVRFDYTVVIYVNALFIFLYLLPFNILQHKHYRRVLNVLFYTVNFFFLLFNFADCEYFKYTSKRTTADIFAYIFLSKDTVLLLPQFLKDFWYVALAFIAIVTGGIYVMNREPFKNIDKYTSSVVYRLLIGVLLIVITGILFVGARGTGLKPVRIISASRYTTSKNIPLVLNTPFTIILTIDAETIKPVTYLDSKELPNIYTPEQVFPSKQRKVNNVVIIILESFSKEFVGSLNGGKGYTPCFDSIIHQGLVFENAFANGRRSIEAVPAIFAGMPVFTDDSYISGRYSGNRIHALPSTLAQYGYQTSFFHGGRNGTMGFDEFCHIAGIKHYYGLNEYKGPPANDGNWGIYDEEFLQFYARELDKMPQPFFSGVFTLSSHHPYKIPEKHKNDFLDAPNELVRSIRYADYALGKFFQTIAKEPWFKNTLFVFSADHTAKEQSALYGTRVGMYRIPIVYYFPGDSTVRGVSERITQQTDVMPSLMDYLGIDTPFLAFGSSVFSNNDGYSASFLGGIYHYIQGDHLLLFDGEKSIGLYRFSTDKMLKRNLLKDSVNLASSMETKLKAMIQQYNNRLLNNTMFNTSGKK